MLGIWNALGDLLFVLGFMSSGGSFPEPLSFEDEKKTVADMMAGDEAARRRLIQHNLRLVAHIAKKIFPIPRQKVMI